MKHMGEVDEDSVLRARSVLLASGRRTPREEVGAYRVLARVSPVSYLPRLVGALRSLSYDTSTGRRNPACLPLLEEAVAAARAVDPGEPARAELLYGALDSCQRELYTLDRRTEGLALRAEMLAVGRAEAELSGKPAVRGLREWAAGLSEEGRHAEAADALTEWAAAVLPEGPTYGELAWPLLQWAATLRDAGRTGEALAAFETLVSMEGAAAAADRSSLTVHLYTLIGYARMLDTCDRREQAAAVRQQARAVLEELAATGERKDWGGCPASFWPVVLSVSGADSERPVPGEPRPPSGTPLLEWSPDTRSRHFDSLTLLRDEVDTLAERAAEDPDRHLAELVRLHRVLTVRSTVHQVHRTHLFGEQVRSLFDDGVALGRRLSEHRPADGTPELVRNLVDRSTFHTAVLEYGPALDDFRQALRLMGEADRPDTAGERPIGLTRSEYR